MDLDDRIITITWFGPIDAGLAPVSHGQRWRGRGAEATVSDGEALSEALTMEALGEALAEGLGREQDAALFASCRRH